MKDNSNIHLDEENHLHSEDASGNLFLNSRDIEMVEVLNSQRMDFNLHQREEFVTPENGRTSDE